MLHLGNPGIAVMRIGFLLVGIFYLVCHPCYGYQGDAQAGKQKSQTCVACHQGDGNSVNPIWPKLAGQHAKYLEKQLKDFRQGEQGPRYEPSMYGMVAALSDEDIADLAAFYSSQKISLGAADEDKVALGERIYRGGNFETKVVACGACHGPQGLGNSAANYPRLSGQHADYVVQQLKAFANGSRSNSPAAMMHTISKRMTEEEMQAVASYIQGLR